MRHIRTLFIILRSSTSISITTLFEKSSPPVFLYVSSFGVNTPSVILI